MPIGCAGVAVYPGDVLMGDRDGVIVIPRPLVTTLAEPSLEQEPSLSTWVEAPAP